ncbi:hypothetical protein GCK72_011568 [Caenorhabditis remanei]|uniref:Uncharacterized protein n=1 Tax=Caenorhabditis remanei TaxID=31234 RepID=A0A6A5HA94_CAERE|nr:hypothetical protein GCK72_011568 [Caenorhabditis remanei]KAF1763302.1 hypothetical protein GCK72_011568 [Caenorhabditis remanei]
MVNHEALKTLAFVFFYFFMLFVLLDTGIFYENDVKFQETHFWMQGPDTWRSTIKTVYLLLNKKKLITKGYCIPSILINFISLPTDPPSPASDRLLFI